MLFFPFSILCFLLFFFSKRQNLDASLFCVSSAVSAPLYPANISHILSFISVSLAPVNPVCGTGGWSVARVHEGACVSCSFSASAAPRWLRGRFRHPCSLPATRCRRSRVSQEEPDKLWRFHINLSERMSAAGNVQQEHVCHICLHPCDNNPEVTRWKMTVTPWII